MVKIGGQCGHRVKACLDIEDGPDKLRTEWWPKNRNLLPVGVAQSPPGPREADVV